MEITRQFTINISAEKRTRSADLRLQRYTKAWLSQRVWPKSNIIRTPLLIARIIWSDRSGDDKQWQMGLFPICRFVYPPKTFPEISKPGIPHYGAYGYHTFPKRSQITGMVDDAVHELCGGSLRERIRVASSYNTGDRNLIQRRNVCPNCSIGP